ncbi:SdrD B-like domain-containing protein [Tahibacter aquaticus]|nr:SdrD B-like domain-containing protein [Tahibacter aquaticus]
MENRNVPRTVLCSLRALLARLALLGMLFLLAGTAQAQSVCAEVKIEIRQTVTLERQAFDATLKIRNGLSLPVEAIKVELRFTDANGVSIPATNNPGDTAARFFFREDGMVDIVGTLDGTATVAAQKTGEAHWLIIPSANAGGVTPDGVAYRVGAKITYRLGEETKTVDVTPDTITVRPQPKIRLDYFLPGPVYGDDPFTPAVEPMLPFTLGVRVWNYGYGRVAKLGIESGQPKIVENRQGLLVDFRILDGFVDAAPAQPSLALDFAAIEAAAARMGRWNMTASLSGRFDEFKATIRHADELGGELTALIRSDDIATHKLIRDVRVDLPGRDGVRDYLAYQNFGDVPKLFESDGGLAPANLGATPVVVAVASLSGGGNTRELSIDAAPDNFVYSRIADPFDGAMTTVRAVREDGRRLAAENAWFSRERNAGGDQWLYYLNLFDHHGAAVGSQGRVRYTLTTDAIAEAPGSLSGQVFEDLDADGLRDAGEPAMSEVEVTLGEAAGPTAALARTRRTDSLGRFVFDALPPGDYSLTVAALAGYSDGQHRAGSAGGEVDGATIRSIHLAAAQEAVGYSFAKSLTPDDKIVTDQSVEVVIAETEHVVGRPFDVIVYAYDPKATRARVELLLPTGAELSEPVVAQDGSTFDGYGTWLTTPPANGRSVLRFKLMLRGSGATTLTATITPVSSNVVDLQLHNNRVDYPLSATAAAPFELELAALPAAPRVLVLLACAGGTSSQSALPAKNLCGTERLQGFAALLAEAGVEHKIAQSDGEFRTELRSGHWNTYWIASGAAAAMSAATNLELAQALLREEWLIADQPRGNPASAAGAVQQLEQYIPVTFIGGLPLAPGGSVTVAESSYLPAGTLQVYGERHGYAIEAPLGGPLGTFDNGATAITQVNRTLLFGFDLYAALQGNPAYRQALWPKLFAATRPPLPTAFPADVLADVQIRLKALTAAVPLTLRAETQQDAHLQSPQPLPGEQGDGFASWSLTVPAGAERTFRLGLRPGLVDAGSALQATARNSSEPAAVPKSATLAVPVVSLDTLAQRVRQGLALGGQPQSLLADFDRAMQHRVTGLLDSAIAKLLAVSDAVDTDWRDNGNFATPLAKDFGLLIQALQRESYRLMLECEGVPTSDAPAGKARKTSCPPPGGASAARGGG